MKYLCIVLLLAGCAANNNTESIGIMTPGDGYEQCWIEEYLEYDLEKCLRHQGGNGFLTVDTIWR